MDLSNEEPSHELSQNDPLGLEHSLMTAGSSSLDALGGGSMLLDESEDHQTSTELQKVRPKILQKSALATLVEVPKLPLGKGVEEVAVSRSSQKKVLCVAPAPYHRCVAFHGDYFVDPADPLKDVETPLKPSTQQMFEQLRLAGPFPRRGLKGFQRAKPSQLGEGRRPSDAPWTAREERQLSRDPSQLREESSNIVGAGIFHAVDSLWEPRRPQAQNLKDFFPASARGL